MRVTVLMPVYNAEKYLASAIQSILDQTYKDFELLLINDGSTDKSVEVIESFNDSRIKLVHNEQNINVESTLNRGLDLIDTEYIARMDSDDIAFPNRLQKQVEYMDKHPEVGVCSSWIHLFDAVEYDIQNPTDHDEIQCELLFHNVIAHPGVIMRKSLIDKYNLRYAKYRYAEDLDMWMRCSFLFKLHNVPEVLLNYRISSNSVSQAHSQLQNESINKVLKKNFEALGLNLNDDQINLHKKIGYKVPFTDRIELTKAGKHLYEMIVANQRTSRYPKEVFKKTIIKYWYTACDKATLSLSEKLKIFLSGISLRYLMFDSLAYRFIVKTMVSFIKKKLV
jgi:glycosyltransferase involved in cell wall biosynthesis